MKSAISLWLAMNWQKMGQLWKRNEHFDWLCFSLPLLSSYPLSLPLFLHLTTFSLLPLGNVRDTLEHGPDIMEDCSASVAVLAALECHFGTGEAIPILRSSNRNCRLLPGAKRFAWALNIFKEIYVLLWYEMSATCWLCTMIKYVP